MDYSMIISDMTWSYSRIKAYESCPYSFLLRYVFKAEDKDLFFSSYGSFIHKILEKFYKKELPKESLVSFYLMNFEKEVHGKAPSDSIFKNYFRDGLAFLKNVEEKDGVVCVEERFKTKVGSHDFVGVIDLIEEDTTGGIIVTDHKSRDLKPRSKRGKYTKTDKELDDYLKQLYIYASVVKERFHRFPKALSFNCFRTGTVITEPFVEDKYNETIRWADELIGKIIGEKEWNPNMDFFRCRNLCGVNHACEYYELGGFGK